jgi:GNAT superfamily N-acetyltransferase
MNPDQDPGPSGESQIRVLPATAEQWPAIEEFFGRIPCWCQYWRVSASEYGRGAKGQELEAQLAKRRQALRHQLEAPTPPGVVAYLEDQMVGWCGFGPRPQMERLVRSRTIPALDDLPVWSIVCFEVRPGFRRRGVARALLQGAIDCARACGVPALEAYPVDPEGARISAPFAYVGLVSMFERAGFRRMAETSARSAGLPRWLMRLDLHD